MKRKKTTIKKPANKTEKSKRSGKIDEPFVPIFAEDGKVIGLITDRQMRLTGARKKVSFQLVTGETLTGKIIPYVSDEELRRTINDMLPPSKIHVTVAGGIVRHDNR